MKRQIENFTNKKFGKLLVIKLHHTQMRKDRNNKRFYWLCKCDCGNEKVVEHYALKSGATQSCGCLKKEQDKINLENKTHQLSNTRLYRIWQKIKNRCYDKNNNRYNRYGGRGIKVCDEWLSDFMNFYNWAINNGYSDNLTIDRIDVNGNYEPKNCRWATYKEQSNNKENTIYLTYNNETKTLTQWAEQIGLSRQTLVARLKRGWNIEKAITTPLMT